VICLNNDKFAVVEYSEIGDTLAKTTDDKGSLVYNAANIANHFYSLDFLKRIEVLEDELSYHIARKKITHVDLQTGELVVPTASNGIKLELFIFDVFPFSERMSVLEVERACEFSPLKNKTGADSAESSRRDVLALHKRFAVEAGGIVGEGELEISPLVSYEGEGLDGLKGVSVDLPMEIAFDCDLKKLAFSSNRQ
jgi:UDP-N-acetylglucosamine/UDP-N-acetylgalactosamine diphosphorylase